MKPKATLVLYIRVKTKKKKYKIVLKPNRNTIQSKKKISLFITQVLTLSFKNKWMSLN